MLIRKVVFQNHDTTVEAEDPTLEGTLDDHPLDRVLPVAQGITSLEGSLEGSELIPSSHFSYRHSVIEVVQAQIHQLENTPRYPSVSARNDLRRFSTKGFR